MSISTQKAGRKWENQSPSDFLQVLDSAQKPLGWIDSNGVPQGTLSGTTPFLGAPAGPCLPNQTAVNSITGEFYSCKAGSWVLVASTSGSLVSPVASPNPLAFDVNLVFKGPNPYVDATRFGVRAVVPTAVPAIPGITANCVNGSPNITISAASTFQNGDGVALYGCGAGTISVPAAPTVTPSLAAAQTGTLLDVNAPAGSTTYCYQIVARTLMGATNVSSETCTSIGQASLGLQTIAITSASLSNTTATYTTSAPHTLAVGAHIVIEGMSVNVVGGASIIFSGGSGSAVANTNPFNGWFTVAAVPDNTHFIVNLLSDTRNGAINIATGGNVNYWNSNHITASETTGNFQYYVYGRVSGGTKTLIGVMWPQNHSFLGDATYLAFDDFGSQVTVAPNVPAYIPTIVPASSTNEMLSTTIVSGAGTTSLVLANNAGNTISGATILFDDAVTILAAATYAANIFSTTTGSLMLPSTGNPHTYFVFNSPISLGTGSTSGIVINQKGAVWVNEPITLSGVQWYGQPVWSGVGGFSFTAGALIICNNASPGLYATGNVYFSDLNWSANSPNGQTLFIQDNGGIPAAGLFRNMTFGVGYGQGPNFSNMGLVFRGGAGFEFIDTTLTSSQNAGQGFPLTATTPGIYFNTGTNAYFKTLNLSGIGIAQRVGDAGGFLVINGMYSQGSYMPYVSLLNSGSALTLIIDQVIFDTTNQPLVANYGGAVLIGRITNSTPSSPNAHITGSFPLGGQPRGSLELIGSGSTPQNTGINIRNVSGFTRDGVFGAATLAADIFNKSITLGPGYSLFTTTGYYPAPIGVVSAGGSITVGSYFFYYIPIFANGSEGQPSQIGQATTTSGNQTITVSWSPIPGVSQYNLYGGLSSNLNSASFCSLVSGTNSVFNSPGVPCAGGSASGFFPYGGPAGMQGSLVWAQKLQIGLATIRSGTGVPSVGLCTTTTGGEIYLRTDGTTTTTLYVCDGVTGTWTAK